MAAKKIKDGCHLCVAQEKPVGCRGERNWDIAVQSKNIAFFTRFPSNLHFLSTSSERASNSASDYETVITIVGMARFREELDHSNLDEII